MTIDLQADTAKIFGKRRHLPILRQTEAAECGIVCLAMIAAFWGKNIDVTTIRQRFAISSRGTNIRTLMKIGDLLGLSSRAVRIDIVDLDNLRLPAILHWEFKHFVVLRSVGQKFVIHDPRLGTRNLRKDELNDKFTGVALELWPASDFSPQGSTKRSSWRSLLVEPRGFAVMCAKLLTIGLAIEAISLLTPMITQWGIDNIASSGDLDLLTVLAMALGTLLVLQAAFTALRGWAVNSATTSYILNWKMHIFAHMTTLSMRYFELRRVGDITSRYDSVERIIGILNDSFVEGILDSAMGIFTISILFVYNVPLTLITLLGASSYVLLRVIRYGSIRELTQESLLADARENSSLIETIRGIRPIKLFGREKGREQEWVAAAVDEANASLALSKTQVLFRFISNLISGGEQVIIFWLCMRMVTQGQMTIGMIVAYAAYRSQFYSSVSGLVDNYISLQIVKIHAERVADIVLATPEENTDLVEMTERIGALSAEISVQDVTFRYGAFDTFALQNISIKIEEGENVALVGRSGCGKSSLMSLLVGLYEPEEGRVSFGGIPLAGLGLAAVRRKIAVVMQDDMLFAGTIAQNIASFDANLELERLEECARIACIDQEIITMPMGYGSLVSDLGSSLSGGQRQRVCIARALYKQPRVLLMDEATSHLDVETEREINAKIQKLGITRIIIAHRLDTIRSASRLVLLESGKIIADTKAGNGYEEIIDAIIGRRL
ncbi:peptidase domain-containing ABC transporter (plasmid) [Rhizobium lusitanum]|uniref:peptidase domain-containing ABC transporter n=1 Tax=Rhizobium lusitanum TaxID=293958 RepID=UPI0016185C5D|nr:peptidase domain-containing ABC transporter [Rhizobium lusitanum]QND44440.1 peptidase domain-containing ABC transporter [Rhizobium lusitanum]